MKGGDYLFIDLLYYKLQKMCLKRGGPYIDSSKWIKNEKAAINPKNKDDKCFKHALTVALNHEHIKSHPERISKIKPFLDQYNWKGISFPLYKEDWEITIELNNKSIALNILYVPHNTEKIKPAYKSKYNNQVNLLMITDCKKWHYLDVKNCLHYLEE